MSESRRKTVARGPVLKRFLSALCTSSAGETFLLCGLYTSNVVSNFTISEAHSGRGFLATQNSKKSLMNLCADFWSM